MRWTILASALGLTACAAPVTDAGLCIGLNKPVGALRDALEVNATTTPDAVGEAGTDVVLGFEAGCVK